jgi:hypothetical protein
MVRRQTLPQGGSAGTQGRAGRFGLRRGLHRLDRARMSAEVHSAMRPPLAPSRAVRSVASLARCCSPRPRPFRVPTSAHGGIRAGGRGLSPSQRRRSRRLKLLMWRAHASRSAFDQIAPPQPMIDGLSPPGSRDPAGLDLSGDAVAFWARRQGQRAERSGDGGPESIGVLHAQVRDERSKPALRLLGLEAGREGRGDASTSRATASSLAVTASAAHR